MRSPPIPWVGAFREQLLLWETQRELADKYWSYTRPDGPPNYYDLVQLLEMADRSAWRLPRQRLLARVRGDWFYGLQGPVEVQPSTYWLGDNWKLTQLLAHKRHRWIYVSTSTVAGAVLMGNFMEWTP